ncbi:MAG: serine/threonine-protein kinase [Thermoanaerobaculia bacterium]
MTNRWETIFDELAEAGLEERTARLAELATKDAELARFLTGLLAADETRLEFIGSPILARAPAFVASALEEGVDRRAHGDEQEAGSAAGQGLQETIGPYRLVRCLGEGGMGEVFLAERVDGEFEQRVAIKRIRAGLESKAIADRFLRERQILARLEHPGIAHLLDGGSTEDGDPYFVLEHIEGVPITTWCEQRAAPLEQRLRLMIEVADAVDAAHRQLVVHRDLKPTNILVTASGRVKLLDFGIAKLLQAEAFDERQTQLGGQPLTPAYAAPEQILGEVVTTATDVYSMGALLFELITGRPPFDRAGRPLPALARAVDSETLERPSVVAATAGPDEPEREIVRGFAGRLAGDLDTVVLKALDREPARRYPSAAAFGDDLRRFLEGRPVTARPDTSGYRARKFIGRHRWAVAAGALSAVALVAGIGIVLRQSGVARDEARRADRVKSFLIDLFREADPSQTLGNTITAREILDKGATGLEAELVEEPAVRAELLDAIAEVERNLGLLDPAAKHSATALGLRRALRSGERRGLAASLVTEGEIQFDRGELVAARERLEEALRVAPGLDSLSTPLGRRWTTARLGVLGQQLDIESAEPLARRILAEAESAPIPDPLEIAHWRLGLAGLLVDSSRVGEAEPLLRQSLAALVETHGRKPLELATARLEAGEMLDLLGDKDAAEHWMGEGLDLERSALGADHPEVALWEIKLGYLLSERRRFDDAERILQHAVSVLKPLGHYDAGSALRYLGFVSMGRERFDEAYGYFLDAEQLFRETVGDEGGLPRAARLSEGWALLRAKRYDEARKALESTVAETSAADGPESLPLRTAIKYLGELERETGHPEKALEMHRRALAIELKAYKKDEHLGIAASKYQIALDLMAENRAEVLAEAGSELADAIAMVRKLDPDAPRLEDYLLASGRQAMRLGDREKAGHDWSEAVTRYRAHDGPTHARTLAAERELAQLAPPGVIDGTAKTASRRGPQPD